MTLISQGAEAKLVLLEGVLHKERVVKSYRHQAIDAALRLSRTNREKKVLLKAKELGVRVPELFTSSEKYTIVMEYILGTRLKDWLNGEGKQNSLQSTQYLKQIGSWLATLHDNNILHGDLTTSNVLRSETGELVMIDFGLSFFSTKIEDRAVDLHVFSQALESTHYEHANDYFSYFLKGYRQSNTSAAVLQRLAIVQARGRNKH